MKTLALLQSGEDARRNWRRINDLTAELQRCQGKVEVLERKVADLCRLKFNTKPGVAVKRLRLKFVLSDALACVELSGEATEGDALFMVARPPELRCSIVGEAVGSLMIDYTYTTLQQRTATCVSPPNSYESMVQLVSPAYDANEGSGLWSEIFAIEAPTNLTITGTAGTDPWVDFFFPVLENGQTVEVACNYIDLNVAARCWCTVPSNPTT